MALPTDLSTLDYVYYGAPHCWVPSKTVTDVFSMDFEFQGAAFVGNQELVASADISTGTLDEVWAALPFVQIAADYTLDFVYQGVPFISGASDRDRTIGVAANVISITPGPIGIDAWNRKHPNPRLEMVYSEQEPSHIYPYIGIQAL